MPGTAILGDNLVDDLVVDVIDGLRGELHPEFGVRAYRVFFVTRTWAGRVVGEGKRTDVAVELLPQPKIDVWDGRSFQMLACGLNEVGDIRMTEISLTYTYAELYGYTAANVQRVIRIDEAHGQATPSTFWIHNQAPFIDREKTLGWICWLKKFDFGGEPP